MSGNVDSQRRENAGLAGCQGMPDASWQGSPTGKPTRPALGYLSSVRTSDVRLALLGARMPWSGDDPRAELRKAGSEPPWLIVALVVVVLGVFGAGAVGVGVMVWLTTAGDSRPAASPPSSAK